MVFKKIQTYLTNKDNDRKLNGINQEYGALVAIVDECARTKLRIEADIFKESDLDSARMMTGFASVSSILYQDKLHNYKEKIISFAKKGYWPAARKELPEFYKLMKKNLLLPKPIPEYIKNYQKMMREKTA